MRATGDAAISDIAGTLLLVLAVVIAGGGVATIVAANLQVTGAPAASLALGAVEAGDTSLRLLHRNGDVLELNALRVSVVRASGSADVPSSQWSTPVAGLLRPGDTLTLAISPAVAEGERVRVELVHREANARLADLTATAPSTQTPLPAPTLAAGVSPASIVADAATSALLTVRVSHPLGALGVASVTANLTNLSVASRSANETLALLDLGTNGDAQGGDGVYSALLRAPVNTTPGTYTLPIVARDVAGYDAAQTSVQLTISGNFTSLLGNISGLNLTHLNASTVTSITGAITNLSVLGNLTSLLANLTGAAPGAVILNGTSAGEGTRLAVPTSENITRFHLVNWTYERSDPSKIAGDAAVVRIIGGSYAWSAYVQFSYLSNTPGITRLEMWNANSTPASGGRTVYVPVGNNPTSYVSLIGLSLNMTDPTQNGFTCIQRCSPAMTYQAADIRGKPIFAIAWMRDESNNPDASDLGILSMEASFA